jgi:Protein of unknown function (DUF642)/PEP-CTERM motif
MTNCRSFILRVCFVALLFFVMAGSLPLHATITNGSFEDVPVPAGSFTVYTNGSTALTGWTIVGATSSDGPAVVSNTFMQNGITFTAQDGVQWLDLTGVNENSTEGVEQTVATTPGKSYALSFWVGNVYDPGGMFGTTSTVDVYINGALLGAFENSSTTPETMVWEQFDPTFTATGSSTTIKFLNADPSTDNGNGLDNVALTLNTNVTPEPGTMILYGTGLLGIMGLALSRKRLA